ncbi:hypothetical protein Q5752_002314 [Cryptotrichosporon argae]
MGSKPTAPALIHVPARFSIVEPGVYRSASPTAAQVPYLASLALKTIVSLTPEHPTRPLVSFVRDNEINFVHLGVTLFRPMMGWEPVREEIVKTALELILDARSLPVLVIDPLGIHHTGVVFGCLRVMQRWNFAAVLCEYREHSGSKHRLDDEQYIELFDPDIVNLPPREHWPSWWRPPSALVLPDEPGLGEAQQSGRSVDGEAASGAQSGVDGVPDSGPERLQARIAGHEGNGAG